MLAKALLPIVLAAGMALTGCASTDTLTLPPSSANDSTALQYARAMGLTRVNDRADGQPWEVYAVVADNGHISFTKQGTTSNAVEVKNANGNLVEAALFANFDPTMSALSLFMGTNAPQANDFRVVVGYWGDRPEASAQSYATEKYRETVSLADPQSTVCPIHRITIYGNYQPNIDGALPSPPNIAAGNSQATIMSSAGAECFYLIYRDPVEKGRFGSAFSEALGDEYAVYLPGMIESEPLVFHNGQEYRFVR